MIISIYIVFTDKQCTVKLKEIIFIVSYKTRLYYSQLKQSIAISNASTNTQHNFIELLSSTTSVKYHFHFSNYFSIECINTNKLSNYIWINVYIADENTSNHLYK